MDDPYLQLIHVRLPGHLAPLHFLRLNAGPAFAGFPGSEPLCVADGHLLAAHSSQTLLRANHEQGLLQEPVAPTRLSIDAKRCRRALTRPHTAWSAAVRGALAVMDDLLFDAAASLGQLSAAEAISDRSGFHDLYAYIWGDAHQPPPCRSASGGGTSRCTGSTPTPTSWTPTAAGQPTAADSARSYRSTVFRGDLSLLCLTTVVTTWYGTTATTQMIASRAQKGSVESDDATPAMAMNTRAATSKTLGQPC